MLNKNIYISLLIPLFLIFPANQGRSKDLVNEEDFNIEKMVSIKKYICFY